MFKPKPARLNKCNAHEVLEQQLTISVKQVLLIFLLVLIFGIFCFLTKGPTYGYL